MAQLKKENYDGSDCTGSDGDSDRTLTISNKTTTSGNGFLVFVDGLSLALTEEYTVSHNVTSSVITFINGLYDAQEIIIQYVADGASISTSDSSEDFINGPLTDFGVTAVRTPVTMTTDFHGNKTYTDGTDANIEVVFNPITKEYTLDKAGLTRVYDATVFLKSDATLNKYDKITYDSKVYRVDKVSERDFNGTRIFRVGMLFFISDE